MQAVTEQEKQVLSQIKDLVESLGPDSYVGAAMRRAYDGIEAGEEEKNTEAVADETLRSVRLPSATVQQWEAESSRGHSA